MMEKGKTWAIIPTREELFQAILTKKSVTVEHLCEVLSLTPEQIIGVKKRLDAMVRDGQVFKNKSQKLSTVSSSYTLEAQAFFDRDGSMSVASEKSKYSIYIPKYYCNNFLSGDIIEMRVSQPTKQSVKYRPRSKRFHWLATPIALKKRVLTEFVAQVSWKNNQCFLVPVSKRYRLCSLLAVESAGLKEGMYVKARMSETSKSPMAEVIRKIGEFNNIEAMTEMLKLNYEFGDAAYQTYAEQTMDFNDNSQKPREDLTHLAFCTIDGAQSKDFDDAIYVQEREDGPGWIAYVAIADVSHYVKPNSSIDEFAKKVSTSVYLPHEVTHMLPRQLSEEICSLTPGDHKSVMVVRLSIDGSGVRESYSFHHAIIQSHARLTYEQVDEWINSDDDASLQAVEAVVDSLIHIRTLTKQLLSCRKERGALEIHAPNFQIKLDDQNKPISIVESPDLFSSKMIEELMLLTNVTVAEYLNKNKYPCIYRSHESPQTEKIFQLRHQIEALGLESFKGNRLTSKQMNKMIDSSRDSPWFSMINDAILRVQSQATYTAKQLGHYGLGYTHYCHFTSPIRRYPDLIVHRLLKAQLGIEPMEMPNAEALAKLSQHCTTREKMADEAQRMSEKWFRCAFIKDKIGHVCEGMIVRMKNFGFFVRLDEYNVEGMVSIAHIDDDYYHFDAKSQSLIGRDSGQTFQMGVACLVKVRSVSMIDMHIDFDWVEMC